MQCVKLVKLLKPKYVTVEEVPQFLIKNLMQTDSKGKRAMHTVRMAHQTENCE